ncbi:MAG: hypothetical protein ACKVT1_02460 [Dehalococcoidia bacterium]
MPGNCTHHYLLPPPAGPAITGRCKLCGFERSFKAYIPEVHDFVYNRPSAPKEVYSWAERKTRFTR